MADLFCGAGGTSTGAIDALRRLGYDVDLTAVNHWDIAVATHTANHPAMRHLCASVDALNPRQLFKPGELDLLWASPECMHHSRARGGKPVSDQSRASGMCVIRWAEALQPGIILVENVPEFVEWGPIGSNGKPLKSRRGETFRAWCGMLAAMGYQVQHRILCAADYGDPTTRRRLFVQAVRGRRKIIWPDATHAEDVADLFGTYKPWVPAREVIDWSLEGESIFKRKRPLAPATLSRIEAGLRRFGLADYIVTLRRNSVAESVGRTLPTVTAGGTHIGLAEPFLVAMEHGGSLRSIEKPINTITTAKGGAHALVSPYLIHVNHEGGDRVRSLEKPLPTIAGNRGEIAKIDPILMHYYGNGFCQPVTEPVATLRAKGSVGLVQPELLIDGNRYLLDIKFRMLQPHELAAAQGFPKGYRFTGNKTETVRQIGNAVPCGLARALVLAAVSQRSDIHYRL